MRTIFTFLLCVVFAAAASGQKPEAEIQKSEVAPVVDGEIDDLWADVTKHNIDQNYSTELPTLGASGETTWQAVWVPGEGIYILLIVNDDGWYPSWVVPSNSSWEYDKPEIYFDCNQFNLVDGGGASGGPANGHHQIAPWVEDASMEGGGGPWEAQEDAGVYYSIKVNNPDYVAEYFVPFEFLVDENSNQIDQEGQIGFDVTIIDRDEGDGSRKRAVWANTGANGESWSNMNDCGIITLQGAEPPIYITTIDLTGGEIDMNNGSLQIEATITPENYTEGLKWSLENNGEYGRAPVASITNKGLLTARTNGTVTVVASSASDVVIASVDVPITNQLITMMDLNLIRNGDFSDLDEDGYPTQWSGGDGEQGPAYVNEEGFVVLDPEGAGANVWDFRYDQQNFGCNEYDPYTLSFKAYADAIRTFDVDFEDPADPDYNRYGSTTHPSSEDGQSQWTFDLSTEATWYEFDVVFDEKVENTTEHFNFFMGTSDTAVYIDSVMLINDLDKELLMQYNPVTWITVSGAEGVTTVPRGGTLQMSAEVLPVDADYLDVRWSVMPQTGWASIDEAGLLTGDSTGTVVVKAHATDDSKVVGELEVTVSFGVGIEDQRLTQVRVYPNPAVNELNVELSRENTRVAIYNSVGMKMDEAMVSGTQHRFDISSYPGGIYFVKTQEAVAKFIK